MPNKLSASQAIHRNCIECCNNHSPNKYCVSVRCPLFPYKSGKKIKDIFSMIENTKEKILRENLLKNWAFFTKKTDIEVYPRLKSIKLYCKLCRESVRDCNDSACALYVFRLGKNGTLHRELSSEQRERCIKNLYKE